MQFNQSPYFDDFDESNHHVSILFRPDRPIQARELNSMQSIYQNQIERFGNHIFKNGSKVSDARTNIVSYPSITINPIEDSKFLVEGCTLKGRLSGQEARFILKMDESVCVTLIGSNTSGTESKFFQNELVDALSSDGSLLGTFQIVNNPTYAETVNIFVVEKGVFYYNGLFIENTRGLLKVDLTENKTIGFQVVERIVTPAEDPSILDNNTNVMSYMNSGADRYEVSLVLTSKATDQSDTTVQNLHEVVNGFITLATVTDGEVSFLRQSSDYAQLGDMLAQRTYEESGNYTVKDFKLEVKNHKAAFPTDDTGISVDGLEENYVACIGAGKAYVRGYRVETISKTNLISQKARDTVKTNGFIKQFEAGSYIKAIPASSSSVWPNNPSSSLIADGSDILLYDGTISGGNLPSGQIIGHMTIADGTLAGYTTDTTPRAIYQYYVSSLTMNAGKNVSDVKTLYHATNSFIAESYIDALTGSFTVVDSGDMEFIWEIDKTGIKSLRDIDDATKGSISLTQRRKFSGTLDSSGYIMFNAPSGEYFKNINNASIGVVSASGVNEVVTLTSLNTVVAPESIQVSLGAPQAGKKVTLVLDVMDTNMTEKTKTLRSEHVQFNDATLNSYTLDRSDIISCTIYVFDKTDPNNTTKWIDVTDKFTIFNGQTDIKYTNATLTRNALSLPLTIVPATHGYRVEYEYFHHTGNQGYFTVDSYQSLEYGRIPSYQSNRGHTYKLSNCFDFRPLIISDVTQSAASFPSINQIAIFDIENYVGRVDSVVLRKDGGILILNGIPSETPVPLEADPDYLTLYELTLKPYTFNLHDITARKIDNRGYTMNDIHGIDNRLAAVEYYTVLSLLEKSAKDMSIKDADGLDRFKNGFVVDDFSNFQVGDVTSNEFKASHDMSRKELRSAFTDRSRKMTLDPDTSYGYTLVDGMAYLPWENIIIDQQPFATKSISINPYFMVSKKGRITLTPNNDTWVDTTREPDAQVNIDTGTTAAISTLVDYTKQGVVYGSWAQKNKTLVDTSEPVVTTSQVRTTTIAASTSNNNLSGGRTSSSATVTTIAETNVDETYAITEDRTKKGVEVSGRTDTYSAGDRVTDVSLNSYLRSIDVEFQASDMLPTTKVWAFFDGVDVSEWCRDIKGQFGGQLMTDELGEVHGIFRIPEGRFFVGEKIFKLSGDPLNEGNVDTEFTRASSTFFGGGISVTKEKLSLNVVTPAVNVVDTVETRVHNEVSKVSTNAVVATVTTTAPTSIPANALVITARNQSRLNNRSFSFQGTEFTVSGLKNGDTVTHANLSSEGATTSRTGRYPIRISGANISNLGNYADVVYREGVFTVTAPPVASQSTSQSARAADPVAQSFNIPHECFITGMDAYFERVDVTSKSIFVQLRTMSNGYPTEKILAETRIDPVEAAKFTSIDASVAYHVDFKYPVYIKGDENYCFVIGGDSPATRVWVSRLGDVRIDNPDAIVETQPSLGSSFRSQNGSTWNAEQYEDIKYNLYCAQFTTGEMGLTFNVVPEEEELGIDPFECEAGVKTIRVFMNDHGFIAGDTAVLNMFSREVYRLNSPSGTQPMFGQTIKTSSGSAVITNVKTVSLNQYDVEIKSLKGLLLTGEAFKCESEVLYGIVAPEFSGTISTAPLGVANGINLSELNSTVVVKAVDSHKSFLVDIKSTPTNSGRFGGTGVKISANYRYEIHNTSGEYSGYNSEEVWSFTGIDDTNSAVATKVINMKSDYHLERSGRILSKENEESTGVDSIDIRCRFNAPNELVTPVINTNTFSTIFITNSIDDADPVKVNVSPNATGIFKPETDPNQGSYPFKYVTRKVTLAKPATDLRIAFDAYKDSSADFDVYVKTQEQYDTSNIDDVAWRLVATPQKTHSSNLEDRIEYELTASENVDGWADTFISFKLKIVGKSTNPAKPPIFKNLRIIAFT